MHQSEKRPRNVSAKSLSLGSEGVVRAPAVLIVLCTFAVYASRVNRTAIKPGNSDFFMVFALSANMRHTDLTPARGKFRLCNEV